MGALQEAEIKMHLFHKLQPYIWNLLGPLCMLTADCSGDPLNVMERNHFIRTVSYSYML